jgi:hypothetical protein
MDGFWQDFATEAAAGAPYQDRFTVAVGARLLDLPIRPLPQNGQAVASLIANQASFAVIDAITVEMTAWPSHPVLRAGSGTRTSCRSATAANSGTVMICRRRSAL